MNMATGMKKVLIKARKEKLTLQMTQHKVNDHQFGDRPERKTGDESLGLTTCVLIFVSGDLTHQQHRQVHS